ncbi:MAG: PaaI family thioesterase [Rubrivivax sp.]|nr:PaaI family thioesterase [Rubrivivax sp.]
MSPASDAVPAGFAAVPMGGDFVAANGPLWLRHEGDLVRLGLRVERRHCNPMGVMHGGMIATFCDMLLPIVAHRRVHAIAERFLPTIGLQVDYLAPAPLGAWLEGEAEVLRVTTSMVFAQGLVRADGTPVARTSGTFRIGPVFAGDQEPAG